MGLNKNKIRFYWILPIIIYGFYCSITIGNAWDTFFFIEIGKNRLDYLLSLGLKPLNEGHYMASTYIGIYNILNAFFLELAPRKFEVEFFHILNFIISFFSAIGLYKLVKQLFNSEIGFLTLFIFLLFPIFFGHMAINDRDTVVVFSNIWITYYAIKYFEFKKNKNDKYVLYISFLLALGLGVRLAFVATLFPIIFYLIFLLNIKKNVLNFKQILFDFIKVTFYSLITIVIFWAPIHEDLVNKTIDLISKIFSYGWGYPFTFVNGVVYESNNASNLYILENLFFKTPEYILGLYLIFFIYIKNVIKFYSKAVKYFNIKLIFILLNILLPSILLFFNPFAVYDGLRLFLFILPYYCIIPALVLFYLFKNFKEKFSKILLILISFLSIYYLQNFIKITPYHYTYLNFFTGDYSKANLKFENDYWGTSLKELIIKANKVSNFRSDRYIKILVCGVNPKNIKILSKKYSNLKFTIVRPDENPEFVILSNRVLGDYNFKVKNNMITCFDKYSGKAIIDVKRRDLTLSAIKELKK